MSAPHAPSFRANNDLALHLADPDAAAAFYERTLVPIGPHSPDGFYLRDPSGVVFDVIQRDAAG